MGELDAALDALGEAARLAPDNSNIRDSLKRVKRLRASADAAG
jgi:cytochrome c-type biogenesis protein CcmH/NrfG